MGETYFVFFLSRWAIFPTSAKSGEGISDALAWLLLDSIDPEFIDAIDSSGCHQRFKDSENASGSSSRTTAPIPFLSEMSVPCKFRLIPNDDTLDRFNFEEREAQRLKNPFYSPSVDADLNCSESYEGLCMTTISQKCRASVPLLESAHPTKEEIPPSLIGKPLVHSINLMDSSDILIDVPDLVCLDDHNDLLL